MCHRFAHNKHRTSRVINPGVLSTICCAGHFEDVATEQLNKSRNLRLRHFAYVVGCFCQHFFNDRKAVLRKIQTII